MIANLLVVVFSLCYFFALVFLRDYLGIFTRVFAVPPILLSAWFYGKKGGVLSAITFSAASFFYFNIMGENTSNLFMENILSTFSGVLIGYALGYSRDVNKVMEQVKNQLNFMKLGIERSKDIVFITDPNGVINYVNPAFTQNYGYTSEEAIGNTPRLLKSGVRDLNFYKDFWKTIKAGKRIQTIMINKTKDGNIVDMEASVNPILADSGEVMGFLAIQRNVTEKLRTDVELKKRVDELAKLNDLMIGRELKMVELKKKLKQTA
jgi:PAS domain S-box-containing protein